MERHHRKGLIKKLEKVRRSKANFAALGNTPHLVMYLFFLVHMAMFGSLGFAISYGSEDVSVWVLLFFGGLSISVYCVFYIAIFGLDAIKWMFINAGLGVLGIFSQIHWILELFNKDIHDFHWTKHILPFLYFVLYTFLIRNFLIDLFKARSDEAKRKKVNQLYLWGSISFYILTTAWYFFG